MEGLRGGGLTGGCLLLNIATEAVWAFLFVYSLHPFRKVLPMITTMTPVREMPSSTRLTPTFTPPNTKSIASQGAPALQQRQGLTTKTVGFLEKQLAGHANQIRFGKTSEIMARAQQLFDHKKQLIRYFLSLLQDENLTTLFGKTTADMRKDYTDWLADNGIDLNSRLGGYSAIRRFVSAVGRLKQHPQDEKVMVRELADSYVRGKANDPDTGIDQLRDSLTLRLVRYSSP
jgi:hypothetical protein